MSYNYFSEPDFYSVGKDLVPAGIHIGIVKSTNAATKSVMVLVPSINENDVIGPCRIVIPLTSGATAAMPAVNTKVIVAFLDGSYDQGVCLGKLL